MSAPKFLLTLKLELRGRCSVRGLALNHDLINPSANRHYGRFVCGGIPFFKQSLQHAWRGAGALGPRRLVQGSGLWKRVSRSFVALFPMRFYFPIVHP